MGRVYFVVIATFILCLLYAIPASAQCSDDLIGRYKERLRNLEVEHFEARQVMMDTDPADWSTALQDSYLNSALWVVYYGMLTYGFDGHFSLPADPAELVDLGYIQTWPLNPYNNWEPMQVLDPTDEFSPGDLCLLVPVGQREHGSKMASELCIYGPDIDYALHGDAEPMDFNEDWVIVPEGAVYMLGIG